MSRLRSRIIWRMAILFVITFAGLLPLSPVTMRWVFAQGTVPIPTNTPTPDGGQEPTSPPGSTSSPPATEVPTLSPQRPTSTRPPLPQPTATRPATTGGQGASATPTALISTRQAAYPTAEACSLDPTLRVLEEDGAWVYEGPGEDYDRLGRLEEGTVRPILARAADARWWLIALPGDESGWIADDEVEVQGDTSELPLEEAPALPGGETPTPGPTWEPTPNPDCATPTATPAATEERTSAPSPAPTATATPEASEATATATMGTEPLPVEEEGSSLMWLPVAGLLLLAAGAFLYVTRRS